MISGSEYIYYGRNYMRRGRYNRRFITESCRKGEYVIVEYEGEIYPGEVKVRSCQRYVSLFYHWIDVKKILNPTNITPLKNRGVFRVVEMEAEWGHYVSLLLR